MITIQELKALNDKGLFNGLDKVNFSDTLPAPLSATNINAPAGILASLSPSVVENILAKRTGDEALGSKSKLLEWEDEKYFLPFVEKAGQTTPYADNSTPLYTSLNASYNNAGHYRFTSSFVFGDLQARQFSKAKINYADVILRSATEALAVELNRSAFNGYIDNSSNAMLCYGLLNHTELDNYVAETKTFENSTWEEIVAFFAKAIKALVVKSGNNVNGQSTIRCVISASAFATLQSTFTSLGISVFESLQKTYPNMQFVSAIELDNAYNASNVIYFIGENALGGLDKTTDLGYSELAMMGNVVQNHNGYSQSVSAGTIGAVIYKPTYIVRFSGI